MTPPIVAIVALAVVAVPLMLGGTIAIGLAWDAHDRQQRRLAGSPCP